MNGINNVPSLLCLSACISVAQLHSQPPAVTTPASARPPYLLRGDELEKKHGAYRKELETFFNALHQCVKRDAPELLPRFEPPLPVPYGYQILPNLLPDPPRRSGSQRIRLSPFSWSRTDSIEEHDRRALDRLNALLGDAARAAGSNRHDAYGAIVTEYKRLVAGQKFIESLIQYNRFWQGDIASHPIWYAKLKSLANVALERQRLNDSVPLVDERSKSAHRARADSLSRRIEDHIRKLPTPEFVRVEHPAPHRWVLAVPMYTDIEDSGFVERFREAVEAGWRVRDGDDDFRVKLQIRRLSPSVLYSDGHVPEEGTHIDVDAHTRRFPPGGVVLTTGGNAIRQNDRGIILSPYPTRRSTLVHEFGHVLGFKDGYFRSCEDRGADGYEVVEVILNPDDVVVAPEGGPVRREYFEQILRERQR